MQIAVLSGSLWLLADSTLGHGHSETTRERLRIITESVGSPVSSPSVQFAVRSTTSRRNGLVSHEVSGTLTRAPKGSTISTRTMGPCPQFGHSRKDEPVSRS
jgi:hypothetical protein